MPRKSAELPSSKHALALSLALHELATNATKYGALSRPAGRVRVEWRVEEKMLHLDWEESGGPPTDVRVTTGSTLRARMATPFQVFCPRHTA